MNKILGYVLGAVLFLGVLRSMNSDWATNSVSTRPDDVTPSVPHLWDAYRIFNSDYFYGGLPGKQTKIELTSYVQDDFGKTVMAEIRFNEQDQFWHIKISSKFNPIEKQAELSLAHEMCHQEDKVNFRPEGLDGHSGAFQPCMQRLAKDGAFKDLW